MLPGDDGKRPGHANREREQATHHHRLAGFGNDEGGDQPVQFHVVAGAQPRRIEGGKHRRHVEVGIVARHEVIESTGGHARGLIDQLAGRKCRPQAGRDGRQQGVGVGGCAGGPSQTHGESPRRLDQRSPRGRERRWSGRGDLFRQGGLDRGVRRRDRVHGHGSGTCTGVGRKRGAWAVTIGVSPARGRQKSGRVGRCGDRSIRALHCARAEWM